jgi:hypothetical protein
MCSPVGAFSVKTLCISKQRSVSWTFQDQRADLHKQVQQDQFRFAEKVFPGQQNNVQRFGGRTKVLVVQRLSDGTLNNGS